MRKKKNKDKWNKKLSFSRFKVTKKQTNNGKEAIDSESLRFGVVLFLKNEKIKKKGETSSTLVSNVDFYVNVCVRVMYRVFAVMYM